MEEELTTGNTSGGGIWESDGLWGAIGSIGTALAGGQQAPQNVHYNQTVEDEKDNTVTYVIVGAVILVVVVLALVLIKKK